MPEAGPARVYSIPGAQGAPGTAGADGADGANAFSVLTGDATAPAVLDFITINVDHNAWTPIGAEVWIEYLGRYAVESLPSATQIRVQNLDDADNAVPGSNAPAGAKVTMTGRAGADGSTPADALLAASNLIDLDDAATARSNLGLGTAATAAASAFLATANNLSEVTPATARTNLGLGTMAIQAASAVAITGGALNGTLGATTPATASVTTLAVSSTAVLSGNLTNSAKLFLPAGSIQTLAAGNTISPTATKIKVAGSGGAVTLSSTPHITNPVADGQVVILQGTHDTNTLTVSDNGTVVGSKLRLGANTRVLGKGDQLILIWDQTDGLWYEQSYLNLV